MDVGADGLAPGGEAGVVARVARAGARHQQLRRRPRPALLRLQADAAARRVKVQDLIRSAEKNLVIKSYIQTTLYSPSPQDFVALVCSVTRWHYLWKHEIIIFNRNFEVKNIFPTRYF